MRLPFSQAEFLHAFGAYNAALWPAAAVLWVASVIALVLVLRGGRLDRGIATLLAVHWAWAGIAYHLAFFARINPAARLFAGLFLIQAALFAWAAAAPGRLHYAFARTPRHIIGAALAAYGLAYPLLAAVLVHSYPRTPTFGVPCPTALFTAGLLLMAHPVGRWLMVIPVLWSGIGGSAAVFLGVATDFVLIGAGAFLVLHMAAPRLRDRGRV